MDLRSGDEYTYLRQSLPYLLRARGQCAYSNHSTVRTPASSPGLLQMLDGLFANLVIIRQGYGHAYTPFPFRHMDVFRAYERRAREASKGLWDVMGLTLSAAPDTIL